MIKTMIMTNERYPLLGDGKNVWPWVDMDLLPQMEAEMKVATECQEVREIAEEFCDWFENQGYPFTFLSRITQQFIYDESLMLFRAWVLKIWAERWSNEHLGGQVVMNDHLAPYLMELDDALSEAESGNEDGLWTTIEDLWDTLCKLECHIEIGTRMGMHAREIAMNDVLSGYFCETFDPRIIDMAKALTWWVETHIVDGKESLKATVAEKLDELCEVHDVVLMDKEMTLGYLRLDVIPVWVNNNK